jgi:TPR repeat protein
MYRVAIFNDIESNIPNILKKDPGTAFTFAKKAATMNHLQAMVLLSGFYLRGYGIEINQQESKYWTEKHTEKGKNMSDDIRLKSKKKNTCSIM